MKKLLLFVTFVGISGLVQATTINAPSSLTGTGAMVGGTAYSWGISIPVPSGETVTSAQIDFSSITLTVGDANGTGTLFTDLLNSKTTGVNTTPNTVGGISDYWATKYSGANISSLGSKYFPTLNVPMSWDDVLSATELTSLNSYLTANNGVFDIGFTPDCHYNVGNISFVYTLTPTTHNTVPDVATTALLLVLGLAGLEVFRRQFVAAKMKA